MIHEALLDIAAKDPKTMLFIDICTSTTRDPFINAYCDAAIIASMSTNFHQCLP